MKAKDWFYILILAVLSLPIGLVCCEGAIILQIVGLVYGCIFFEKLIKPAFDGKKEQDNSGEE